MNLSLSHPPVLGISGESGSGKTLLIERLVPRLMQRGLRIAVVKHCTHSIEADTSGKDSDRIFSAGADVLASGPSEAFARFHSADMPLRQAAGAVGRRCDLCIVEGYGDHDIPRIRVSSSDDSPPSGAGGKTVLVVTDVGTQIDAAEAAAWEIVARSVRTRPTMGLILAGGDSQRMGRPKTLLQDDRGPIIERIARVLGSHCRRVVIGGSSPLPASVSDLQCLVDVPGVEGPLAGILSAMRWQPGVRWLVVACDMPLVTSDALEWVLTQVRPGTDAVMPRCDENARCEPLVAAYEPTGWQSCEQAARRGQWSLRDVFDNGRVARPVVPPQFRKAWTDVDTPEEWETYRCDGPTPGEN